MPEVVQDHQSLDGTRKWLFALADGQRIETVFIPEKDRGTLCISSQVGCALDCSFCATGKQGFNRNLTAAEIVSRFAWPAGRSQDTNLGRPKSITNVVLMGMGEPLLNFEPVLEAISVLLDDLGYGISKRRLTLSTAGWCRPFAPWRGGRTWRLPSRSMRLRTNFGINWFPSIVAIRSPSCSMPARPTSKSWENGAALRWSTLLAGVNDRPEDAEALIACLARLLERVKLNLIPFNPFPGSGYARPDAREVRRFQERMMAANYATMVRTTRGDDIDAACGQLAGAFDDRTKRRTRYLARLRDHGEIVHGQPGR